MWKCSFLVWQVWPVQASLSHRAGCCQPHSGLIAPTTELSLTRAMGQLCPTTALGGMLCKNIPLFLPSATRAGPWEGEEVFCCGCSSKGWPQELGSWRRQLGGAGFPAIVGEIFLLCFSHNCLAVADAVSAATGLLGQRWALLPVPAGLLVVPGGSAWSLSPQQCFPQKMQGGIQRWVCGWVALWEWSRCICVRLPNLGSIL